VDALFGWVFDWVVMEVPPEWVVLATLGTSVLLLVMLFVVLERVTRAPAVQVPRDAPALRVPPYVDPRVLRALQAPTARHRAIEGDGRLYGWQPTRRENV
jgi:hypothetical protein